MHPLLLLSCISRLGDSFCFRRGRRLFFLTLVWNDVPSDHHGVVFMHDVVTVHDVFAMKVFPAHKNLNLIIGQQRGDIAAAAAHESINGFSRALESAVAVGCCHGGRWNVHEFRAAPRVRNVAGLYLLWTNLCSIHLVKQKFGEMRVDGMRPVLAFVAEGPHFGAAFFDGGAHYRKVARALPVYRPDSSAIIELPNPSPLDFIHIDGGQLPESLGNATWISCSGLDRKSVV